MYGDTMDEGWKKLRIRMPPMLHITRIFLVVYRENPIVIISVWTVHAVWMPLPI